MAYVEGQLVHDADSHIMEAPDFLDGFVESRYADAVRAADWYRGPRGLLAQSSERMRAKHDDPAWRAAGAEQIMLRKNYDALGAWRREDRGRALDHLGFRSQLVFPTWFLSLNNLEYGQDLGLAHAVARAFNRAMVAFCSIDRRMLSACYVPLADF
ncbi:MAG TPA: hypothetical protein VEJ86_14635, partial [Candidatus Binataceae bacterium]|nr:hypothetical protein [Candidatus Binataceae bacterium]